MHRERNWGPTDDGIAAICKLSSITNLELARASISDDGLRIIAKSLPNLKIISINAKQVTDIGIMYFADHPVLLISVLDCPKITADGQSRVQKAMDETRRKRYEEWKKMQHD